MGTVARAVASDSGGPQFESSQWPIFISNGRHLIDRISDWPNPRGFTKGVRFVCLNRYIQVDGKPFVQSEIRSIRVLRHGVVSGRRAIELFAAGKGTNDRHRFEYLLIIFSGSMLPFFPEKVDNMTIKIGQNAELKCKVENLNNYKASKKQIGAGALV